MTLLVCSSHLLLHFPLIKQLRVFGSSQVEWVLKIKVFPNVLEITSKPYLQLETQTGDFFNGSKLFLKEILLKVLEQFFFHLKLSKASKPIWCLNEESFLPHESQQPLVELPCCYLQAGVGWRNFAAVACKSILRASPRAYWNSRGVVTRPSGRDDHQRWCFGWEIQGGNSGSPLKSLDVSWLSFRSLHTTSHLFSYLIWKSAIYGSSFFCRKKEVARWMLTPRLVLADISSIVLVYATTARMSQGPGRKRNLGYH